MPQMKHCLFDYTCSRRFDFPLYLDYQIGLSVRNNKSSQNLDHESGLHPEKDIVQQHKIEQTMDDDVQTDSGIMRNAKGTCLEDLEDAIRKIESQPLFLASHNKEIKFRVKHPDSYTRAARFKESHYVGFASQLAHQEDTLYLARIFRDKKEPRHASTTRFDGMKRSPSSNISASSGN